MPQCRRSRARRIDRGAALRTGMPVVILIKPKTAAVNSRMSETLADSTDTAEVEPATAASARPGAWLLLLFFGSIEVG